MAHTLLGVRRGKRRSERFMTRSAKLNIALTQAEDRKKRQQEDPEVIDGWFKLVADTIAKYDIHDDDVHNFDETSFQIGVISLMKVVTGSERRTRP